MAHLPPAGIRLFTNDRMSHLPTMSEIPTPGLVEKRGGYAGSKQKKPFTAADFPPLKNRDGDWPPPQRPRYPKYPLYDDGSSARCQCNRPPRQLGENARHIGKDMKDPRTLPYGLPPMTYDVRRRADWFDNWKEQMARYSGAFVLWHREFGNRQC